MVTETILFVLYVVCNLGIAFIAWLNVQQFNKERNDWIEERVSWQVERNKLLDRIQSSGLAEFKAQERADTPIKRKEKDSTTKALEKERWL